jgi:hypothetical protein
MKYSNDAIGNRTRDLCQRQNQIRHCVTTCGLSLLGVMHLLLHLPSSSTYSSMHTHVLDLVVLLVLHCAILIQSSSSLHLPPTSVKAMTIGYEAIKFERRNFVLGKSSKLNSIYQTLVGSYFPNVFIKCRTPHRIIFEFIAYRNVLVLVKVYYPTRWIPMRIELNNLTDNAHECWRNYI